MPGFLCDLHIHSCLSPCGDEEMTPYNLVNMAKVMAREILTGLPVIRAFSTEKYEEKRSEEHTSELQSH